MSRMPVMQSAKMCANCVYWTGAREPEPFFGRMTIETSPHPKGMCTNSKGFYRLQMNWNTMCPYFVKHPIVKS